MIFRLAACWLLTLAVGATACAAELFYMDHDEFTKKYVGPVGPLVYSGEIVPGDYDRLVARILEDENRFLVDDKLMLASNGGDVSEAIRISIFLQSLYAGVSVSSITGPCVGACFLIYSTASQRSTDGERLVGVHRPALVESVSASLSAADAEALEDKALQQVRGFLVQGEVPTPLVDRMFQRAADDVYWLNADDETALGAKSPSFERLLKAKCNWDPSLERDVLTGKRPFGDLTERVACRQRVVQPAARAVLRQLRQKTAAGRTAVPETRAH